MKYLQENFSQRQRYRIDTLKILKYIYTFTHMTGHGSVK